MARPSSDFVRDVEGWRRGAISLSRPKCEIRGVDELANWGDGAVDHLSRNSSVLNGLARIRPGCVGEVVALQGEVVGLRWGTRTVINCEVIVNITTERRTIGK